MLNKVFSNIYYVKLAYFVKGINHFLKVPKRLKMMVELVDLGL